MKYTRIAINALTVKGRKSLAIQKADEIELRAKYRLVPRWKIPFNIRSYLKTVSVFAPNNGDPENHTILGFKRMNMLQKNSLYVGIKKSFYENGCTVADFEVKFFDE